MSGIIKLKLDCIEPCTSDIVDKEGTYQ